MKPSLVCTPEIKTLPKLPSASTFFTAIVTTTINNLFSPYPGPPGWASPPPPPITTGVVGALVKNTFDEPPPPNSANSANPATPSPPIPPPLKPPKEGRSISSPTTNDDCVDMPGSNRYGTETTTTKSTTTGRRTNTTFTTLCSVSGNVY